MLFTASAAAALVALVALTAVHGNPDAKRLYDDLLSNYNRLIRPVANNTDKITVKMGLKLSQLVDLVGFHLLLFFNNNCLMTIH
jgi:nicotinic acetylcholine receptor